jgi:dTDP-4-amino-4,6-dideoxygalactose transaminase
MDPQLLEDELAECRQKGQRPAAVLMVDVNGQCADYDAIETICQRFEVPLIEDAAEALGAQYRGKAAGSFGQIACFSFNGNKIITTSGGGMLVARDEAWARHARFLSTQARDPVPHYEHSHVGYNYRMSNLLAAVGRGQLRVLEQRVLKRRANFKYYVNQLSDLPGWSFMPEPEGFRSTNWLSAALIDPVQFGASREEVRLALESHNIESRALWKPMHLQPVFRKCRSRGGAVSEQLFEQGLCLPSGSSLTDDDLSRIVSIIRTVHG